MRVLPRSNASSPGSITWCTAEQYPCLLIFEPNSKRHLFWNLFWKGGSNVLTHLVHVQVIFVICSSTLWCYPPYIWWGASIACLPHWLRGTIPWHLSWFVVAKHITTVIINTKSPTDYQLQRSCMWPNWIVNPMGQFGQKSSRSTHISHSLYYSFLAQYGTMAGTIEMLEGATGGGTRRAHVPSTNFKLCHRLTVTCF